MIILLSGKQGSGKTTIAKKLVQVLNSTSNHRAMTKKFADPIYEMHDECLKVLAKYGIKRPNLVKDGPLLQLLGTEWGRNTIDRDIWAKCTRKWCDQVLTTDKKVIPIIEDCRFPNELEIFHNAFKVRLVAKEDIRKERCEAWRPNVRHRSETAMDDVPNEAFNLVIHTDICTLDGSVQQILEISHLMDDTYVGRS